MAEKEEGTYTLYHYVFDAKAKLYDLRKEAYKSPNKYEEPVMLSNKYKFEVYEIVDEGHGQKLKYTPDDEDHLSEVERYEILEKVDTKLTYHEVRRVYDSLKKLKRLEYVPSWFPTFDESRLLIEVYEKILHHKVAGIKTPPLERVIDDIEVDKLYRMLIEDEKIYEYEDYELEDDIYEMILYNGYVDPIAYMSHDLTYFHPLFKDNLDLICLYSDKIKKNKYYLSATDDMLVIKMSEAGEGNIYPKSMMDMIMNTIDKIRNGNKDKNDGKQQPKQQHEHGSDDKSSTTSEIKDILSKTIRL